MKNKRFSVSIGIPVYNEEKTIVSVINSLLKQKADQFKFENIFVVSDGSTDSSVKKINHYFKDNRNVHVIDDSVRLGKSRRLLQIFELNKSDIILIFDGDIEITDSRLAEKLVKKFIDQSFTLVSGNSLPRKTKFFFGRVWYANEMLWYRTRKDYLEGNNIYNNSGQCIGLSKNLAKKIFLPKNTVADQQFIYLSAINNGAKFVFVDNAVSYYTPPTSLNDIVFQIKRTVGEKEFLSHHFKNSCDTYFYVSKIQKIKGFLRSIRADIVYTLIAIVLFNILRFVVKDADPLTKKGQWKIAESTKKYS